MRTLIKMPKVEAYWEFIIVDGAIEYAQRLPLKVPPPMVDKYRVFEWKFDDLDLLSAAKIALELDREAAYED